MFTEASSLVGVTTATVITATATTIATTATAITTTATAETTATTAAATKATTATLWTLFTRACFVDCQVTAHELSSVKTFDRRIHFFDCSHGNESEATRATRLTILDDENVAYSAMCFEELTDFAIVGVVGQIAYIHLCIHIILYLLL